MIPVFGSRTWDPKTRLMVEVTETAIPSLSMTEVWLCYHKIVVNESLKGNEIENAPFHDQRGCRTRADSIQQDELFPVKDHFVFEMRYSKIRTHIG